MLFIKSLHCRHVQLFLHLSSLVVLCPLRQSNVPIAMPIGTQIASLSATLHGSSASNERKSQIRIAEKRVHGLQPKDITPKRMLVIRIQTKFSVIGIPLFAPSTRCGLSMTRHCTLTKSLRVDLQFTNLCTRSCVGALSGQKPEPSELLFRNWNLQFLPTSTEMQRNPFLRGSARTKKTEPLGFPTVRRGYKV